MAIENLPTVSHVLAGGAGAVIALSIAWSVTRLRRALARAELDALATRISALESSAIVLAGRGAGSSWARGAAVAFEQESKSRAEALSGERSARDGSLRSPRGS